MEFLCKELSAICQDDEIQVTPETMLIDLGLSSLSYVSVVLQLEAIYSIEVPPDEIVAMFDADCIGSLADVIYHACCAQP